MILHRIEAVAVMLATTIATGSLRGVNESLSEVIGFPVDRIGAFADIVAGTLAFLNWRRHKHTMKESH